MTTAEPSAAGKSGEPAPVSPEDLRAIRHVVRELGFVTWPEGEVLRGEGSLTPQMHVPGTDALRTSILLTWSDTLIGLMAARVVRPRVPVTLDLSVHLFRPARGTGTLGATGSVLKAGRSVFVGRADLVLDGERVGFAIGSFMTAPDPHLRMPPASVIASRPETPALAVPFAERVGCRRSGPGVAELPRSEDGLNSSNTVNGGLIALAAEEAILSLAPEQTLCALSMRYLQPVRTGPAIARAALEVGLAQVEVYDAGAGRLAALATGRTFA